jgi:hypothetical protein
VVIAKEKTPNKHKFIPREKLFDKKFIPLSIDDLPKCKVKKIIKRL